MIYNVLLLILCVYTISLLTSLIVDRSSLHIVVRYYITEIYIGIISICEGLSLVVLTTLGIAITIIGRISIHSHV